ncbi:hypothetical protein LQW54_010179 [Pestalotiopsis sp. IQ-011]
MARSKKKKAQRVQRAASAVTNNPGPAGGGQSMKSAEVARRARQCLQERPALEAHHRDAIRDANLQIDRAKSALRRLHIQIAQEYEMESQREAQINQDREVEAQRRQEQMDRDREHDTEMRRRREQSAHDRARFSRARSQQAQSARDRDRDHDVEMRRRQGQSAHARARFSRAKSHNPSRQASRPPNRPDRRHIELADPSAQSKGTESTDRTQNEVPKQPHIGTLFSASRFADVLQRQNEALRTEGSLLSLERPEDPALGFDSAALRVMESIGFNGDAFRTLEEDTTVSVGAARQAQPTAPNVSPMRRDDEPRKVASRFGEPQKPIPGCERIVWVRPQPEAIANYISSHERSLEDIYRDHPEKKLRGLEPETLGLVGNTVHQIAQEAANNWLKMACPGTRWNDGIINVEGIYDFNAPELDYTILDRSLSLQDTKKTVMSLLVDLRALVQDGKTMTSLSLARAFDQSTVICRVVKDNKRRVLLEKAKQEVEWLPVGLDCKKLNIQRRAMQRLREAHEKIRKNHNLAFYSEHMKRHHENEAEIQVLDGALIEFQESRLEVRIELLKTVKQLLQATA